MSKSPLFGKKIMITGDNKQGSEWGLRLEEEVAVPIWIPLISTVPVPFTLEEVVHTYDWIFFTSKNAVTSFFNEIDDALPLHIRIAAIGGKTKSEIEKYGHYVSFVPTKFNGETFAREIKKHVKKGHCVLFPKGNLASSTISEELRSIGITVTDVIVYETVKNIEHKEKLSLLLAQSEVDCILFTSPSTVEQFVSLVEGREWAERVLIACIGPSTEKAAISHGLYPSIVPRVSTFSGMIEEMKHYFEE